VPALLAHPNAIRCKAEKGVYLQPNSSGAPVLTLVGLLVRCGELQDSGGVPTMTKNTLRKQLALLSAALPLILGV